MYLNKFDFLYDSHGIKAASETYFAKSQKDLNDVFVLRKKDINITGALMGMEGAHPLEGDIKNLDKLYDAGYRLVGLQHFFDNELGGSLHGKTGAGLTEFGKQVVKRALEKNMIIDVAHSSHQVVKEVLAIANKPIVLSHTGIHSHCETKRNIPDDLMQAIANNGGVLIIKQPLQTGQFLWHGKLPRPELTCV